MWQIKFLTYLFEVSLSSFAFFILYTLLLKNLTFFRSNRIYLIFALICSFIIPSAQIELHSDALSFPPTSSVHDKVEQLNTISSHPIVKDNLPFISITEIILYIYVLVAVFLLLKGLNSIFQLFRYTRKPDIDLNGLKVIYKYSGFVNCSFFNYVFINPANFNDKETEMLLQHEHVHAKQLHSADKVFMLFCKIILWFNPVIYLYDRELEKAHEYEADATTLNSNDPKAYAQLLIRLASNKNTNALTHNFGKHPVKERITMIFTNRSQKWALSAYTLILPLFIGLTFVFSVNFVSAYPTLKSDFTLILDPGHGGSDDGGKVGAITEKQLALALVNRISSIAESKGLKVLITRTDDSKITLKQRASINGDIFLSIHHNTAADKNKSGLEIISGTSAIPSRRKVIADLTSSLYQNLSLLSGIHTANIAKEVNGSYILRNSLAPSIMLELGYLTNENDKAFLINPTHQDELANAIINSILAYHNKAKPLQ